MSRQSKRAAHGTDPNTVFEQGVALQRSGDLKGAVEKYEQFLKDVPDHPQALSNCALASNGLGDSAAAIRLLEKSVAAKADFAEAWNNLGVLKQEAGDNEGAAHAYDRVRKLVPDSLQGHLNYGNICQLLGRYGDAVSAYEQALQINDKEGAIWSNYARALMFTGAWQRGLEASDRALDCSPGHTGAIALKTIALMELGETGEWSRLVDFDRLITTSTLEPPARYPNLKSFNEALCEHCRNHPTLTFEPSGNTTVNGYQTGNLSTNEEETNPIGELLKMVTSAIRTYQAEHPVDPSHPFLTRQPSDWQYNIWAVFMKRLGHQASHIHRSAWLSGCYYPKMPDRVTDTDVKREGWIEFGRPQEYPLAKAEPKVRAYPPHEGMIVLFPSYFYHRTIPFESDDPRVSIAFDVIPR